MQMKHMRNWGYEMKVAFKQTIKKIRPYLNADGGDIDFVKYENNIVYVKLLGACIGCSSSEDTINNSVEALLVEEVPGVIGVEVVLEDE